ncbi:MAG: glycosyltransferase family 9 protein [Candidatus Kapabacteria bacterium]|nr:glycosyltransferase family 9 protein [Candidatus Kapabacteria bacterium]
MRLSSLGDVLLTTPLIRILSKTYPNAKIDYIVAEPYSEILTNNPYISNLLIYDKSKSIFKPLKNPELLCNDYDILIDLQKNIRTKFISLNRAKIKTKYSKQRFHKLSLVYRKNPLVENFSVPLNYIKSIGLNELEDDALGLEFWLKKDRQANDYLPFSKKYTKESNPLITIAPGARHNTKRWTDQGFIELIKILKKKYDCEINLVGSKSEIEVCSFIQSQIDFTLNDYCGKLSIEESAELIDTSDLVISNDSGIMHIAAARKVPVVVIYGSTVPEFGFLPFRTHYEIVQKDLSCRPCTHIGRESCPKKHFDCMNLITPNDVLNKIDELFKRISKNQLL